jgi:hypothetical protein
MRIFRHRAPVDVPKLEAAGQGEGTISEGGDTSAIAVELQTASSLAVIVDAPAVVR